MSIFYEDIPNSVTKEDLLSDLWICTQDNEDFGCKEGDLWYRRGMFLVLASTQTKSGLQKIQEK